MQRYAPLATTMVIIAVFLAATVFVCRGKNPLTADAPEEKFSAFRAREYLEELLLDEQPHPTSSKANELVRERLVRQLTDLGMLVKTDTYFDHERDFQLFNVLARFPLETAKDSDESTRPLLVVTHYDSVPLGPGAGDAGSCVCSLLETIRVMKTMDPPDRTVYFLFTDGEEYGMRGARQFVLHHPLAKKNPFVLNFDARGASGASLTFETHVGNFSIVDDLNKALPFPKLTGSSFVSVYRLMPNATDFHIFQEHGLEGVNSAFIGSPHRYHTPEDTIENLSLYTLQHHGEKVCSLTTHFAGQKTIDESDGGDAVFFDVFGLFLVWWPAWLSIPLSAIVFGSHVTAVTHRRRREGRPIDWYSAKQLLMALVLALVGAGIVGFFVPTVLQAVGVLDARFTEYDPYIICVFWLAIWACVFVFVCRFSYNLSAESIWSFTWTIALFVNLLISIVLPGFSYYVLLPGFAVAILSWTLISKQWASVLTCALYAIPVCPTLYLLGIAFGPGLGWMLCPVFLMLLFPITPLFGATRLPTKKPVLLKRG